MIYFEVEGLSGGKTLDTFIFGRDLNKFEFTKYHFKTKNALKTGTMTITKAVLLKGFTS
jgi:hypothetical protein